MHSSLGSAPIHDGDERQSPIDETLEEGFLANLKEEEEEFEEDEDLDEDGDEPPEELPWHHQQLYHLYGKQADYFLYPKFQQDKKAASKPLQPRIRKLAGEQDFIWFYNVWT